MTRLADKTIWLLVANISVAAMVADIMPPVAMQDCFRRFTPGRMC
jgi:hypothetical protein